MYLIGKDKNRFKVKGWEKIFQPNGSQKQVVVSILISYKADFKSKLFRRNKENQFILIKSKQKKVYQL
jgi:hypothetical protein